MLQLLSTGLDWTTEGWASLSSAFGNHIRRFEEHQEYSTPIVAIQMLNQFVNNHDISVAFEDTNAAVDALDSSTYEDMKKMFDCHQVTTTRSLNCNHQGTVVNSHSITFRVALPDNLTDLQRLSGRLVLRDMLPTRCARYPNAGCHTREMAE